MRYLPREDAPFSQRIWQQIDAAVIGAAKSQLAGRRILHIEGPLGLGTRSLEQEERLAKGEATFAGARAAMTAPRAIPVPLIYAEFELPIREVAAAEERGSPLDLAKAANAAIACARLEDAVIFQGEKALGLEGLLTVEGASRVKLGDWSQVGQPLEDLIKAVDALGGAGFPGPYAAALAPAPFNALFRVYEDSNLTQMEHVRQMITAGLAKAPTLPSGGLVSAAGKQFASILLAQDMTPAYVGPAGPNYAFVVLESLCARIPVPQAICVLG